MSQCRNSNLQVRCWTNLSLPGVLQPHSIFSSLTPPLYVTYAGFTPHKRGEGRGGRGGGNGLGGQRAWGACISDLKKRRGLFPASLTHHHCVPALSCATTVVALHLSELIPYTPSLCSSFKLCNHSSSVTFVRAVYMAECFFGSPVHQ